ncbi:MAG: nucleotidyltransferase domain-containing protein [Patescibacteria group bacterium]
MSQEEIISKIKEAMMSAPNREHIQSIYLFGSFLHGNAKENSDIDLLFEMNKTLSLFKIFDTQYYLEKKLRRKVDFIEKNSLDKYIKDEIFAEARKIYGKK